MARISACPERSVRPPVPMSKKPALFGFDTNRLWAILYANRRSFAMRVLLAAVITAALAAPALAQQGHVQQYGEPDKDKTAAQKAADKAAADAYQRSLGAIPDKGPSDPWGNVRSDAAKP